MDQVLQVLQVLHVRRIRQVSIVFRLLSGAESSCQRACAAQIVPLIQFAREACAQVGSLPDDWVEFADTQNRIPRNQRFYQRMFRDKMKFVCTELRGVKLVCTLGV